MSKRKVSAIPTPAPRIEHTWRELSPEDAQRIHCQHPGCAQSATECEQVPFWDDGQWRRSLAFYYYCADHAHRLKKAQELKELQDRRGELWIMLEHNGRAYQYVGGDSATLALCVARIPDPGREDYYQITLSTPSPRSTPFFVWTRPAISDVDSFARAFDGYASHAWRINFSKEQ